MALNMFCCLKNCINGVSFAQTPAPRKEIGQIILDSNYMGQEVVIVKNGQRVCGSGGTLASAPLVQSKAYFEVKLLQSGVWGVGLATRSADLNGAPGGHDEESWVLCWDGVVRHNNKELCRLLQAPQEGDVLGVAYDHVELNFFINGKSTETPVIGVRHTVYPALYVQDGAVLDIVLDNFSYPPPQGFDKIMIEQSLL
ncbi:SPRY domain-containing protein 7 [Bacillus rossius redtenbacheri]|uniref:SPRY domain-containing protein 7 n=1 Tax=Bacillus rossius redtenbacheri TaxID=93214 RepID=UPI002FDD2BD7